MKARTTLVTLAAGGVLLVATAVLAQTGQGPRLGTTDPSRAGGQSATQPSPSAGPTPSTPVPGSGSSGMTQAPASSPSTTDQGGDVAIDKDRVKQLQEALKSKGHDPGPIDGIMGPRTQAALREYQQAEKLQSRAEALQRLGVSQR